MLKTCSLCTTIVPMGQTHCERHAKADNKRRSMKSARHGLHAGRWQHMRRVRMAADHGLCTLGYPGCTITATTVHLDPLLGGDHTIATIADLCSACAHCHGVVDAPRAHNSAQAGDVDRRLSIG